LLVGLFLNLFLPHINILKTINLRNMTNQLVIFAEKMKSIKEGNLTLTTNVLNNGFKQAILSHIISGEVKAVWMACNSAETKYLIDNFSA
jgi:hypothetical protein